jgi:hypothetical protein
MQTLFEPITIEATCPKSDCNGAYGPGTRSVGTFWPIRILRSDSHAIGC